MSIHITSQPRDSLLDGVEPSHHHSEICFFDILRMKPLWLTYSVLI